MGDISVKEGMALLNEKAQLTIRLLSIFDGNVYAFIWFFSQERKKNVQSYMIYVGKNLLVPLKSLYPLRPAAFVIREAVFPLSVFRRK